MKKLFILPLLALLTISSCTKTVYESNPTSTPTPYYEVSGVSDLNFVAGSTGGYYNTLNIGVIYTTGVQERVVLSLEGVPAGLHPTILVSAGIPSFQTEIAFQDSGVAEGNHPITLVATSPTAGRRTYTFNYNVVPQPDCSSSIIGTGYQSYSGCSSSGSYYSQNVTQVAGVKNRIMFSNVNGTGLQLYANVDCSNQQLIIPTQTVNGITYSGDGYFYSGGSGGGGGTSKQIRINYYWQTSSGTQYCYTELQL